MARAPTGIDDLDFESLSDAQLREVIQHAREMLQERVSRRLDEFRQLAQEAGFAVTLTKLNEAEPRRRGRGSARAEAVGAGSRANVKPKFQNPDNPSEKWSGRGRKPKWVEEKLAQGRELSDLAIPEAAGG